MAVAEKTATRMDSTRNTVLHPLPKAVESVIRGRALTQRTIAAAAEAVVEGARPLAHNAYKLPLFRGLITEELEGIVRAVSGG